MKKLSLLLVLACIIHATTIAQARLTDAVGQACLPYGITFTTQAQIDSFQINYPNCTEIEGNVTFDGDDIANLDSLIVLTSVEGDLNIGLWMHQNPSLISLEGLNNLTYVGGSLRIDRNALLVDLTGLDNLTSIGGELLIGTSWAKSNDSDVGNPSLISLTGLDKLISIGENLTIQANASLTILASLSNVTSIGGGISISGNGALQNLEGLNNINPASIQYLHIVNNHSLARCEIESICSFLANPSGDINVYDNAPGCNSQEEVEAACEGPCLPEGITFTTQAQIDSFQINYPNCTEIGGDVKIGEWTDSDITNLNGLSVLVDIGGDLNIRHNPLLMNLSGLDNLISIRELLVQENESLQNLIGLGNITSINGSIQISANNALISLEGLEGLISIESLWISNNPSLINFEGLNNVINIDNHVKINYNSSLQSLSGLENLATIGRDLKIFSNDSLISLSGLDNLSSVSGSLWIGSYGINAIPGGLYCEGNVSLVDITALSNLTNIGGDLEVFCNDSLINFAGLENLSAIGGSLIIGYTHEEYYTIQLAGNQSLADITGLQGVSAIGGNIDIQGNISLTSLEGLENIDASTIVNLKIRHNNSLSVCEMQSICDYLSNPGGVVEIHNNALGCSNPYEVATHCGTTLPCLPFGSYYFLSQANIDNFEDYYTGCTELEGDIFISGEDITNLNGLNTTTSIGGDLVIRSNSTLPSLTGLEGLNSIGGDLEIGGFFWGNPNLTNLSGLTGLQLIGGSLIINDNDSLASLIGLENLVSIGRWIYITRNDDLTSIAGLQNIEADSINGLDISQNPSLSLCVVKSVCDYLAIPNSNIHIHNNAPGCNSPEEVLDSCWVSIDEHWVLSELKVQPNPFNTLTSISYDLLQPSAVSISIFNHLGKQIEVIKQNQSQGKQQMVWDAKGLPSGVYFCVLKTESGTRTIKMIKLH